MVLKRLLVIELVMLAISVCASFGLAMLAYLMQGTPEPVTNALAVASTGGYGDVAINSPFIIWGVGLFCGIYSLAGIGLLITLPVFVVCSLIRLVVRQSKPT